MLHHIICYTPNNHAELNKRCLHQAHQRNTTWWFFYLLSWVPLQGQTKKPNPTMHNECQWKGQLYQYPPPFSWIHACLKDAFSCGIHYSNLTAGLVCATDTQKKKKSQKNDKQENCLSSSYWEHKYKHNILNYLKTVHFNKSLQQQLKSVFSHT